MERISFNWRTIAENLLSKSRFQIRNAGISVIHRPQEGSGRIPLMKLSAEVTHSDAVAITIAAMLIPLAELSRAGIYWKSVESWLDNGSYVDIAHFIRFGGLPGDQHFWGLPAILALVEAAFSTSGLVALVVVSFVSSIVASFLMYRLYGAVVTATFLILCPEWVRLSVMGGSEPLFLCLLLGSWLAFRSDRVLMATVIASLATTVRPVGALAICAFAFTLLLRRDWRRLAISVCFAVGIGLAYLAWLRVVSGDAFVNFRLYSADIWPSGSPFSLPFVRLVKSFIRLSQSGPWTRLVQPSFCIAFLGFGVFALSKHARAIQQKYQAEFAFVIGYLVFMTCYNEVDAAAFFPRLAIPVYPFLLFVAQDWLPKSRLVLWSLVLLSGLIASADIVGFRTAFGFSFHS